MLGEIRKSTTFNGESFIELTGEQAGQKLPVANMYANISENKSPSITKNITDWNLYLENKDTVDLDLAEFERIVIASNI